MNNLSYRGILQSKNIRPGLAVIAARTTIATIASVFIMAFLALTFAPAQPGHAKGKPLEMEWEKLMPPLPETEQTDLPPASARLGAPGQAESLLSQEEEEKERNKVVTTFNGKTIRIAGYLVPLDMDAKLVKKFLLVPYFGACIHVPPPPPNQIIFVESKKGIKITGVFEPVTVTGVLNTGKATTELAEAGYILSAKQVVPYTE